MVYCVDTSGWLDGWVRQYPPDVFPTLWRRIEEQIDAQAIFSSEEVYRELEKKDDDLHKWIMARKAMLVVSDEAIQTRVVKILATYPRLVDTLKNRSQADPFVIACAMERSAILVTGEQGGSATRPRIPFVCRELGVQPISFLQMIRDLKLTF